MLWHQEHQRCANTAVSGKAPGIAHFFGPERVRSICDNFAFSELVDEGLSYQGFYR